MCIRINEHPGRDKKIMRPHHAFNKTFPTTFRFDLALGLAMRELVLVTKSITGRVQVTLRAALLVAVTPTWQHTVTSTVTATG
jgi:GTP cyclohydrolase III